MEPEIVMDPYAALESERKLHMRILLDFARLLKRAEVRSGVGNTATLFCALCVDPPCGAREHDYRATCPCHNNRELVGREIERLQAGWRRPEAVEPRPKPRRFIDGPAPIPEAPSGAAEET